MSRNFTATTTPREIADALGVAAGVDSPERAMIQNVDSNARLFLRESSMLPMANHRPHVIPPGGWYGPFLLREGGIGMWAWSDRDSCSCVVSAYVG